MDNTSQCQGFSRQKIRKIILFLSIILLPVTLFYISPIVVMMGASEGVITGGLILFVLLFLLSLFVGRLYCGWICPMGAAQECCSPIIKRRVPDGWRNGIKYLISLLWIAAIVFTFVTAGGIRSVDPFYGTVHGLSVTSLDVLFIMLVIFSIILVVAFIFGKRGFCHTLCPVAPIMIAGRKIRNLIGWQALHLDARKDLCIECGKCSDICPMGLDVTGMVKKEAMETPECILCAQCSDICPKGAIRYTTRK